MTGRAIRRSVWEIEDLADVQWREDWCAWLERYGISPNEVCVPGWLEADDDARQIRYEAYTCDAAGRHVIAHDRCDHDADVRHCGTAREVRVVQLEAPALPFPEVSPG